MTKRCMMIIAGTLALTVWSGRAMTASAQEAALSNDDGLAAARTYVAEHGDRYMDHNRLRRGMKGYGKTVLAGTEIVRFDIEIVSVMTRFGPHQDAILARLSGLGLEKSGVAAGMSGSPCYVVDPDDGKEKMIGAVAFGWSFPKEPLCGIQPITQMLAVSGAIGSPPGGATQPSTMPGSSTAASAIGSSGSSAHASKEFLRMAFDTDSKDLLSLIAAQAGKNSRPAMARAAKPTLVPLASPLMISAAHVEGLAGLLKDMNMVAVQAGGANAIEAEAAKANFEPGGSIAVPLVCGDVDVSAIGTVTDVIGDRVLAFGHAFQGEGGVEFPIAPAYIHTLVSTMNESFKLGSALPPTGTLISDEQVGIVGITGKKAPMLPVKISVFWKDENRRQTYHYEIVRHNLLTPLALIFAIDNAQNGWKAAPEFRTVSYKGRIEFDGVGTLSLDNICTGDGVIEATIQAARPILALARNPFGAPVMARSIDLDFIIESGDTSAEILSINLDGSVYKPGDVVTGSITVRPFRHADKTMPIRFELPDGLAEGKYKLNACDAMMGLREMRTMMPHRFDPKNVQELFQALQVLARPRASQLYLCLPMTGGGLAIRQDELPELPRSKAAILDEAKLLDAVNYKELIQTLTPTSYVLSGHAISNFAVQVRPNETLLRP